MARVFLMILGFVAVASATPINIPDPIISVPLSDNVDLYVDVDTSGVSIGISIRFKRATDVPKKEVLFSLLDVNGDGFVTHEEWHRMHGSDQDYDRVLVKLNMDGDGKISWKEFQAVKDVYFKTGN